MNRLVMVTLFTFLLSGCGKDEEPQVSQTEEPSMQETMDEAATAADEAATAAEEATTAADEAATAAEEAATTADEAATTAQDAATAADEAAIAAEQAVEEATSAAKATEGGRGKEVYDMACFVCHAQGIAGAPKLGDKTLWDPRIAQGMDVLVSHAINGFQGSTGVMPPKGGRMDLSDDDIKAAVTYMVDQAK